MWRELVLLSLGGMGLLLPGSHRPPGSEMNSCAESPARFSRPWPEFGGGPTIGPVTLVTQPQVALPAAGTLRHKVLMLIARDAIDVSSEVNSEVDSGASIYGSGIDGQSIRFTHDDSQDGSTIARLTAREASFAGGPVDFPGWFIVRDPGCYRVFVSIDGFEYGPFAVDFVAHDDDT